MKELLGAIIEGYGSAVSIVTDQGAKTVRAFLQPITTRSWQNMQRVFDNLGELPRGQYLYLGPVTEEAKKALYFSCHDKLYAPRQLQTIYLADQALYDWGLLAQVGEESI